MLKIYFAFILFLCPLLIPAQAVVGVKAGGNIYTISAPVSSDYQVHWQAGFFSKATLSEKFSLQPELLYTRKGCSLNVHNKPIKLRLDYVELPIVVGYSVKDKWFYEAGPVISYLLIFKKNTADTVLMQHQFSPFALGLLLGAGFHRDRFYFTARYELGFTNLILGSDPANDYNAILGSYNRGFQVSVGFVL